MLFLDEFTLRADDLGLLLAGIAVVIGTLTLIFSLDYMRGEKGLVRYYGLILLFIAGMVGLVLTDSLLYLFFFWELVALCSYALISFYNDDPKAVAGGIRAIVITQIGGIGLLAGTLVVRASLGTFRISEVLAHADRIPPEALAFIAFGFLLAAAAKSAQVPFQSWLPGAMEAPTPISALIHAATMVNAGVYLLARFYPVFVKVPGWTDAVMVIGLASALFAALLALGANDLKRVLAYSTVSQLGYMVYAVGAGSLFAAQFHLLNHAIFKALLFLGAGAIIHAAGTRDLHELAGVGRKMPFVRAAFLIGAAALVGLPIFNGFWSKELILEANELPLVRALLLTGVALTALYTVRMLWWLFLAPAKRTAHDAGTAMRIALAPLALGSIVSWIFVPGLGDIVREVLSAPVTYLALAIIATGWVVWRGRRLIYGGYQPYQRAAGQEFGFEPAIRAVTGAVRWLAGLLRRTQTGQLNWNIAGMALGLILVLLLLMGAA